MGLCDASIKANIESVILKAGRQEDRQAYMEADYHTGIHVGTQTNSRTYSFTAYRIPE